MSAAPPQPPTLPPALFAALTPSDFLHAHLLPSNPKSPSLRPNGRRPAEFRTPTLNAGSLTHAHGSAVVRVGDTAVVCGVRGELLYTRDIPGPPSSPSSSDDDTAELQSLGLLVPNTELSTGCRPEFMPGVPPSTLAQSLSTRLLSLLHSTHLVRAEDLRISHKSTAPSDPDIPEEELGQTEVKAYWTLYLDILFISLDGCAFEAAWGAAFAALRDTRLPGATWDPDANSGDGAVVCSEDLSLARGLQLRGLPFAASFTVFESGSEGKERRWVLADPDAFEEGICSENATVVVDCGSEGRVNQDVKRLEKTGGVGVGREEMIAIVDQARERWGHWMKVFLDAT